MNGSYGERNRRSPFVRFVSSISQGSNVSTSTPIAADIGTGVTLSLPAVLNRPLPSIYNPGSLVDMVFYCPPPPRSAGPSSSGSGKPDSKTSASNVRTLHLAATFFDSDDCECSLARIYAYTNRFCFVRHVSTQVRDRVIHVSCPRESSELLGKRSTSSPYSLHSLGDVRFSEGNTDVRAIPKSHVSYSLQYHGAVSLLVSSMQEACCRAESRSRRKQQRVPSKC